MQDLFEYLNINCYLIVLNAWFICEMQAGSILLFFIISVVKLFQDLVFIHSLQFDGVHYLWKYLYTLMI